MKLLTKLLGLAGIGTAAALAASVPNYKPYKNNSFNTIYNLLFCDDRGLFRSSHQGELEGPWKTLFADHPDPAALKSIAEDSSIESRARILAFDRPRAIDPTPLPKQLLGVIIEVGLPQGLDTLAVYPDGRARYINQSEKLLVWEGQQPLVRERIDAVIAASEKGINVLGPWKKARRPPPMRGLTRVTLLVSDGLYFAEGPTGAMAKDPLAGPIINRAEALLAAFIDQARSRENPPK